MDNNTHHLAFVTFHDNTRSTKVTRDFRPVKEM
jgi:hypothetical protein